MKNFECGYSGCGKTNTIMHMLSKPLVFYDKIFFISPNRHQEKIRNLEEIMNYIS